MQLQYLSTQWGSENENARTFVQKVTTHGYDGIEINLPPDSAPYTKDFLTQIDEMRTHQPNFPLVVQHLTTPDGETVHQYIQRMKTRLLELCSYQPSFINSQTGRDFFSFDDNCRVIEAALNISEQTGIRILHETHRARFSFHTATLIPYLHKFPELELVADFSHFCAVSESMLQDQEHLLQQIIPQVGHIHARIGFEQGAQVNDPQAPEWQQHLQIFTGWWQQIIDLQKKKERTHFTITPEFGPAPYMPAAPYTKAPLSNQWNNNLFMKQYLQQNIIH